MAVSLTASVNYHSNANAIFLCICYLSFAIPGARDFFKPFMAMHPFVFLYVTLASWIGPNMKFAVFQVLL